MTTPEALHLSVCAQTPIPLELAFSAPSGEITALVGHSGAGKTTLLRMIAGLWTPPTGHVRVKGRVWLDTQARVNLPAYQRRVGLVFQNYALFPHLNAQENVMAAMERSDPSEAARLLELVNLGGLGARRPAQLSGGQQQRVALARALARKPHALLLDEPFSAVDRATREVLHAQINALRAHFDMPVILVTHDVNEAQLLADRMVVIANGQLIHAGTTAETMSDAAALRAMGVRELAAMLPARVAQHLPEGLTKLEAAGGALFVPRFDSAIGMDVRVRIMAHEVILSRARPEGLSAQTILTGKVARIVPGQGPAMLVHIAIGSHEIIARITRRACASMALCPGDDVHAIIKAMSVARDRIAPK